MTDELIRKLFNDAGAFAAMVYRLQTRPISQSLSSWGAGK